jgi:hypothetical protein
MENLAPTHLIKRQHITGHVAHWVTTFSPPTASPKTPELLAPTNPVPEFMEAQGLGSVSRRHTVQLDLMHGETLEMWDRKKLDFFLFRSKDLDSPFNGGIFPGPTVRVPRGVIFHGEVQGHGHPPHTIHWHGIEPTPMNDGVGHCSMEIGHYIYQWQPNSIGTYFYHCHRNTVQHFKFGLYGMLIVEPPDAFESGPGKKPAGYPRRTAANLTDFPQFIGFKPGRIDSEDPHASTVQYDVEAIWAIDDISSVWMEEMDHPEDTMAEPRNQPGINDLFSKGDFHDFNPDYFFVTGQNFAGKVGSSGSIAPKLEIPEALNSGVKGMQISINAKVHQNILIRALCAAYTKIRIILPVDAVIIAFDGRAAGIFPLTTYSRPVLIRAGEAVELATARRCDFLIRSTSSVNSHAVIEYRNIGNNELLFTGKIPFTIN